MKNFFLIKMSDQQYVYVVNETSFGTTEYKLVSIHQTREGANKRAERYLREHLELELKRGEIWDDFKGKEANGDIYWAYDGDYISVAREKLKK